MVDDVDVKTVFDGHRYKVLHLTNESDGTGEAAVRKLDISAETDPTGQPATYCAVDRIEYSVSGFNYVVLHWDHDTDDEIAVLTGQGVMDWSMLGGNVDPSATAGSPLATSGQGDIILTTDGGADGSAYDITLIVRPKA